MKITALWLGVSAALLTAPAAFAQDAQKPWRARPIALGVHLGPTLGLGNTDPGSQITTPLGVAPTGALEASHRLHDRYAIGVLLAGGLGTGETCGARSAPRCERPRFGVLSAFFRNHFAPSATSDPWMGVGLGGSVLRQPGVNEPDGDRSADDRRGALLRVSSTHVGVEVAVAGGCAWRLGEHTSLGFAVHGFVGPYVWGEQQRTFGASGTERRALPIMGPHALLFASLYLQLRTPF